MELRICKMVRGGLVSKEIASVEHISPATVRKHRERIRRKLGLTHTQTNLASHLRHLLPDGHDQAP